MTVATAMPAPTTAETRSAEDDDSAALGLAPAAPAAPASRPFTLIAEGAFSDSTPSAGGSMTSERVSLDFRLDARLSSELRGVFADLLDLDESQSPHDSRQVNTFKEGYLSWQRRDWSADLGRINVRQGVALGYNPTDFFRDGALRSVDSLDPDSLRQNRLGSVMLRVQKIWDGGALSAILAPRVAAAANDRAFDPDFGATNHRTRWSLILTQRLAADFAPQWIVFGDAHHAPQVGVNITRLLSTSMVAYVEASGGPQETIDALAQNAFARRAWRTRAAAGATYTMMNKMSVSLECEYNGTALSNAGWDELRQGDPSVYGRYRDLAITRQDPPTQYAALIYLSWQDALVRHLDLSAFVRLDLADDSYLPWGELRYHWPRIDAAVRWQAYRGGVSSDYGAAGIDRSWQALVDFYL